MPLALMVVEPFGDHVKGEVITGPDAVAELRDHSGTIAFDAPDAERDASPSPSLALEHHDGEG